MSVTQARSTLALLVKTALYHWRAAAAASLVVLLLLMLACGAAATATPAARPTLAPAPSSGNQSTPTAMPKATPAPAAPVVNPGKVTWMIQGWGNERFTYNYAVGGGNNFARFMQGFLVATNEKTQLLPGIASKWEISPDAKTWTFTIREGGSFHNGKKITGQDVWWSFMHYWGKDESGSAVERVTQSSAQALARVVETITQPQPNQVSITLKQANAGFPAAYVSEAAANWYGIIPSRPKVHDSVQEEAYDKDPVSSGPFDLVKHTPAEVMAFQRFEDYYYQPKYGLPEDRRPKFQSLDLRVVPEEATRVAAIRSGEADVAPASLATRKQVEAGGGRLVFGPEGIYFRIMLLGCYKPANPCYKKEVRQALDYAINKQTIRDQLYGGPEVMQVKGWAHITPSTIGYAPDLDPWPQDTNKARQLLAQAGYPNGQGFGKLIVNTWVSTAMPFLPESAQVAADFWRKELGLDVEVKVGDEAALKRDTLTTALHGQILWRDNEASLDKSSLYLSSYGSPTHGARMHENPEFFDMVSKTLAVTDPIKRDAAFHELNKRGRDESYELGIGYVNIPWAVGPRVTQWQPYPLAFFPSNVHSITLK
ncbi:MAG: ABC transporter substrate-binding protein [SAR202 cluster bacterium]|nr:ABC transporter substrate-binding protein [SAR202 cluster bacterium]